MIIVVEKNKILFPKLVNESSVIKMNSIKKIDSKKRHVTETVPGDVTASSGTNPGHWTNTDN